MTRVMKRQLEEELDFNKPPTIKPTPASREPSTKATANEEAAPADEPEYTLPRDDDEYSPAHGDDEVGTGVGDDESYSEEDVAAANAEREAVEEASASTPDAEPAEPAEPAEKKQAS